MSDAPAKRGEIEIRIGNVPLLSAGPPVGLRHYRGATARLFGDPPAGAGGRVCEPCAGNL